MSKKHRIFSTNESHCFVICHRCHQNAATIELTFADAPSGRQFPQQFCASCFDEVLRPHPEVCQELKQAETEGRPAQLKSFPSELIPETFQQLLRQRRAR